MRMSESGETRCHRSERREITPAHESFFSKLYAMGRGSDVQKATNDREYLKKLMDEYQK